MSSHDESVTIRVSAATADRLHEMLETRQDTIDGLINRMLDGIERRPPLMAPRKRNPAGPVKFDGDVVVFSADDPVNLNHALVTSAALNGETLACLVPRRHGARSRSSGAPTWNGLIHDLVRLAAKTSQDAEHGFGNLLGGTHYVTHDRRRPGYVWVADLGIGIKQDDARGCWRRAKKIAANLGTSLVVEILWQDKAGAPFPGSRGRLLAP